MKCLEESREKIAKKSDRKPEYDQDQDVSYLKGFLTCRFRNIGCDFIVPSVKDHETQFCR